MGLKVGLSCIYCAIVISCACVILKVQGAKDEERIKNEIPTGEPDTVKPTPTILPTPTATTTATKPSTTAAWTKPTPRGHKHVVKPTHQPTSRTTPKQKEQPLDQMDKFMLEGILDIVDEKFTTLNKRLIAMERGINNLQYYNVRSFRVVNTHLHAVDNILHGIHTEIDSVQGEQKSAEQSIQGVRKEVIELQSLNSGMFQAIEQNLVHFHDDMQSRIAELKEGLDQSNTRIDDVRNDTVELQQDIKYIKREQNTILQNTEASVILASQNDAATVALKNISDEILVQSKTAASNSKLTQDSMTILTNRVTSVAVVTDTIQSEIESFLSNFSATPFHPKPTESKDTDSASNTNYREMKAPSSQYHMTCGRMLQLMDEKLKNINVTLKANQNPKPMCDQNTQIGPEFKNQSKKLMRALGTVNENIFQSITLYKHTGSLIERVISDTELIAAEQVRLREDLLGFLLNGTINLFNQSYPDIAEFIDFNRKPDTPAATPKECPNVSPLPRDTMNVTQLVDIMTNLASSSALSINSSLNKLEQQYSQLNKFQEEYLLAKPDLAHDDPKAGGAGGAGGTLRDIHNKTEWIFTLVEAIASNTGWIPYFFHNMRFVEGQVNKTLKQMTEINTKTDDILVGQKASMSLLIRPPQFVTPPKQTTPLPTKVPLVPPTPVPNLTEKLESTLERPEVVYPNQTVAMDSRLNFMYETSLKLNRLIPALTNLLGEPEPYISLVNGTSDKEGRVEIYHKGTWGTLAQGLGHIEASYICRKLGYLGGVSAGSGHFGAGTGTFWNLNVTCLQTRWCDSVSYVTDLAEYQHADDAGVICDHMLRLTQTEEDTEQVRHAGKLEVYHQNDWRPICYKGWGRRETSIVCKQLGFREGAASATKNDSLVDAHWMTGVTCEGDETRLDACQHEFVFNGCQDMEHVSVICS